jgi:hypothetical protein
MIITNVEMHVASGERGPTVLFVSGDEPDARRLMAGIYAEYFVLDRMS